MTAQTVRAWSEGGMPALTEKRPYLIVGQEAKAFLKAREEARKAPQGDADFLFSALELATIHILEKSLSYTCY